MKEHPYLTFGLANDKVGLAAFVLGVLFLGAAIFRGRGLASALERVPRRLFVGTLAVVAVALSWFYVAHYLGGGPRIIDAAAYFLEGRVLSTGQLAFDVPAPSASFRGRFLMPTPDGRLSVIFPPGYPLLLAAGFLVGAPLVVGPLLAGALVVATYATTRILLGDERVARTAAVVSTLCAALRYHTADTMSHGLSALLLTVAVGCAARRTWRFVVVAGLAAGWLMATRPLSGAVAALLLLFLLRRHRALVPFVIAGMVPGLVLFASHAHTATGSWFGSTQLSYYALSDGPPGCFRYGFGAGVGCRFEHGDFVKERLASGFGVLEASWVTIERLALHTIDIANLVPLALLVPWAAVRFRNEPNVLTLALAPILIVLAYVPFYYPASYPGAGARLFADVIPLEQALLALALVRSGAVGFAPGAMLLGFALHGVHQHAALAEREGGRPMFDRSALGHVTSGLVFVGTDHGFLLGHDPSSTDPRRGLVVARRRDDAHDRVLWERLGRPPTVRYDYDVDRGTTLVGPYAPDANPLRFESEAEWPPLAVASGWAHPDFRECLSGGQGLHLRPVRKPGSPGPSARVELELPPPSPGRYDLYVGWLADPQTRLHLSVGTYRVSLVGATSGVGSGPGCFAGRAVSIELDQHTRLTLETTDEVIVDYVELTEVQTKKR